MIYAKSEELTRLFLLSPSLNESEKDLFVERFKRFCGGCSCIDHDFCDGQCDSALIKKSIDDGKLDGLTLDELVNELTEKRFARAMNWVVKRDEIARKLFLDTLFNIFEWE